MTDTSLPTPRLHTARLRLRPFGDADANDLFALHSSAYVLRYWDAPPWSERVRAGRFITAAGRWHGRAPGRGWPWIVSLTGRSSAGAA